MPRAFALFMLQYDDEFPAMTAALRKIASSCSQERRDSEKRTQAEKQL